MDFEKKKEKWVESISQKNGELVCNYRVCAVSDGGARESLVVSVARRFDSI